MIALASGRFDPPHAGHFISLARLAKEYDRVIVVILDYPEQEYAIGYRFQVMSEMLDAMKGNYSLFSNRTHFAKITREELQEWDFDVYASGNIECLKQIEEQGYRVQYIDRAYEYAASDVRLAQAVRRNT